MFAEFKQIFNPNNKDLQRKILFTFVALFVFKLGTTIIVPGIDVDSLGTNNLGFLELINAMGGGALEQFSIFALGVMPYITASIIVQLLQADIIPYFTELSKQGGTGRTKLNRITRYLGIALAFIQGYIFSFAFISNGTPVEYMSFAVILTAGTALLLWIGDQITAKGIGNGISLIIMAGIIATMPNMFYQTWTSLVDFTTTQTLLFGLIKFIIFLIVYVAIILGVVFVESSERRVPIQYANKSTSANASKNYVPFKLNSAGVIPVIFASIIISVPGLISQVAKNDSITLFVSKYLTQTSVTGFILYIACIFAFTYFYTFFQLKPKELAENINQNGGFIPGVRPGEETVTYLNKVLRRITTIGATSLSIIAAIPIIFGLFPSLPSSVRIGGTSLLIVVGVAVETYKQLSSELVTRSYARGRRK
ncbi:MAG: preprotein translocase subunit SecY [Bacilli bacterium]|nr:preprotein translocase subunit SecY [Bacilli bacterium]